MRALVKETDNTTMRLFDVPRPEPGPGEVLVKVRAAAVCGTDLHIAQWTPWAQRAGIRLPLVMGHEFSGEVVALGPDVKGVRAGDYVAGETHVPCGQCFQCRNGLQHICGNLKLFGIHRDGCFAEYATIPAICAHRIPTTIPPNVAAMLEPLGTSVRAVLEVHPAGETVAVLGCGPIGLFAIAAAKAAGASRVIATDVREERLKLARAVGADLTLDARQVKVADVILQETGGVGVDAIVEASGSVPAIEGAWKYLRKGGKVALIGLPSDPVRVNLGPDVIFKEARIIGIHGREMFATWTRMEHMLERGMLRVDPVITHVMPLVRWAEAFRLLEEGQGGKVILTP
ncbi:MAG: L-threonine 3-dehydrogenase [candidate division NC10 bacterium]|nr:L-threonine 3-dehydrogenase [candidate division NC10 bacterium]